MINKIFTTTLTIVAIISAPLIAQEEQPKNTANASKEAKPNKKTTITEVIQKTLREHNLEAHKISVASTISDDSSSLIKTKKIVINNASPDTIEDDISQMVSEVIKSALAKEQSIQGENRKVVQYGIIKTQSGVHQMSPNGEKQFLHTNRNQTITDDSNIADPPILLMNKENQKIHIELKEVKQELAEQRKLLNAILLKLQ